MEAAALDCCEEAAVGAVAMDLSASGPGATAKADGEPTVVVGSPLACLEVHSKLNRELAGRLTVWELAACPYWVEIASINLIRIGPGRVPACG